MNPFSQIPMKYLIVNGDDFGASRGINRGILEAHESGILTSASLMVNAPAALEAAAFGRNAPRLSVGLHADLARPDSTEESRAQLREQFLRFQELLGRRPTHLDSHHNVHRRPQLLPCFRELAREHGLPLRDHSTVRNFSKFYGQWNGETHLEQISVAHLIRMLEQEIGDGITELSCHPGYMDPDFRTGYGREREAELRTLCDPRPVRMLTELSIQLVSYHALAGLETNASAPL